MLVSAMWLAGLPSASATAAPAFAGVGALARVPAGARDLGPVAPGTELTIGLALTGRDPGGLAAAASAISSPGNPSFHHYLSTRSFALRFGPTASTLHRLTDALGHLGLRVGPLPSDHLLMPIQATAGRLERALHTHLEAYRLSDGTDGFAATIVPALPASVAGDVSAVLGLDDLGGPHALVGAASPPRRSWSADDVGAKTSDGAPRACAGASSAATAASGWTAAELAQAYGLDRLYARHDTAAGQSIAVVELEPFATSDLTTFDRCFFGPARKGRVNVERVDGFDLVGPGTDEAALDVEEVSALAPAATLDVYEAPNTTFGTIDEYAAIVSQDRANIVSTSWGECESALLVGAPGAIQVENALFEEAATEGQTWFAAAGDEGADDCAGTRFSSSVAVAPYLSVDDPGSEPYVVSVGGTSLTSDRQPLQPGVETVWNDGAQGGGGGGGYSSVWPMPGWQADGGVPGLAPGQGRATPDVSASADQARGFVVYTSGFETPLPGGLLGRHATDATGGWTAIGGTSAAAPLWAAVAAEIAASGPTGTACSSLSASAGGPDLGFLAPLLYEVAADDYTDSFNDVTVGNNDVFGNGIGYRAGPGYDLASGLGSPIVTGPDGPGLASALCAAAAGGTPSAPARPAVTGLTPAFGPTSGGNAITIGLASAPAAGSSVAVTIGGSPATVLGVDGPIVSVQAPAAVVASSSPAFAGAGPAVVAVSVRSGGTTATSLSGAASTYDYVDETNGSPVPGVTGLGPDVGNLRGGETVTIYGSGFSAGGDSVTFGGVASPLVTVVSDYELRVVVPAESTATTCTEGTGFDPANDCQVEVQVTNAAGASATAPILPALSGPVVFSPLGVVESTPETEIAPAPTEFDYAPTPHISAVSPAFGDESGRQPITITGSGFNLDTFDWVNFGPPAQTQSEQIEESYITGDRIVIDPPAATRDVSRLPGGLSVQTGAGLSNAVRFGYAAIPTVDALSRHAGPATGGTVLTVTGRGLSGVTSVRFVTATIGGVFSQSVSSDILRDDAKRLVVVSPAAPAGEVDVEPCTPSGCAAAKPAETFVFYSVSPPTLSSVTPSLGGWSGGNVVVLHGSNLAGATAVRFGTVLTHRFAPPRGFPVDSPTELAVYVPSGAPGSTVALQVVTPAGTSPRAGAPVYHYA